MGFATLHNLPPRIPEGYWAAPIGGTPPTPAVAAVRIAVLVRDEAEQLGGRLVVLRQTLDSQVFLGCLIDAAGSVLKWVEIAVQHLGGVQQSAPACRGALTNDALDARWRERFASIQARDPGDVIACGWESKHPRPMVIDVEKQSVIELTHQASGGGHHWALCEDDAFLTEHGLPLYRTSLERFLHVPELGAQSPFADVSGGERGGSDKVVSLNSILDLKRHLPFNIGGGLMIVRTFHPVDFEGFLSILSGSEWAGLQHGRTPLRWKTPASASKNGGMAHEQGSLFLERHGRWGRLVESLHLKLRLLLDATTAVRDEVARTQMPLLNITPASFNVQVGEAHAGLPFLWNTRVDLATPGEAVALPIPSSEARYVLRAGIPAVSIYQADVTAQSEGGRAQVRLRQFIDDGGGGTTLDGTLTTQERVHLASQDLLWIRMPLANRKIDLYGRMASDAGTARGEFRFRTVAQRFDVESAKALRAAEGVPIGNCTFEVIPLLSSPCDLYSLAVLAVQTLLVNGDTSLPVVLDAVMSLARELAVDHDPSVGLRLRIQALLDRRPEWLGALGPHRLSSEPISTNEAMDLVPPDVWWDALGLIVQMLPGVGPDSFARDYGDAPAGAIHKAFDSALEQLTTLVVRTRSLVVIDWRFNREIHAVIRRFSVQLSGEVAGS